MPVGPEYITQDVLDDLCEALVADDCLSVRKFFETSSYGKHRGAFYLWLAKYGSAEQVDQFERIMRARATCYQEDCIEIADDAASDYVSDGEGGERFNQEAVQRAKLRIETRLKVMAQNEPKKYGLKVSNEHTGANGGPIQTQDVTITSKEAKAISQALDDEC